MVCTKSCEGRAVYRPFDNVGIAFGHAFIQYHKSNIKFDYSV